MNAKEFNKLLEEHFDKTVNLLKVKGSEYSSDEDRLSNFKREAEENGLTTLQIALIYGSKHFRAIQKYIKNNAKGLTQILSEPIEGRFHDLINYCFLMLAILKEREQEQLHEEPLPRLTYPTEWPEALKIKKELRYDWVSSDALNDYPQCQCPSCFRETSE